jgi:hypothetical protein
MHLRTRPRTHTTTASTLFPSSPVPPPRSEILGSPGGTAKVIQLMYRGILDGQASAGRFLELLAGSRSPAVQVRAAPSVRCLVRLAVRAVGWHRHSSRRGRGQLVAEAGAARAAGLPCEQGCPA